MNDADTMLRLGDSGFEWAKEFSKTAESLGYGKIPVDWLTTWFAGAIEHSSDVRKFRMEAWATHVTYSQLKLASSLNSRANKIAEEDPDSANLMNVAADIIIGQGGTHS